MYSRMCYDSCPGAAPYSINYQCKTCNIVSCYECNGSLCSQCDSGYLLIGDSLCINGCGNQATYNATSKQCEAI